MLVFKHSAAGLCLSFVVMVALAMSSSAIALADSTTGTITVTAGTLMESSATSPALRLTTNGLAQTASYALAITMTDATGSGSGWNLTITSTTFSTDDATPHTLSTSASFLTGVTAACIASTTCKNPTNSVIYPEPIPADATAPPAVKFFNAAANTGMGRFSVTPTISILLPAGMYPGVYSSIVTLAIVSGP